MGNQQHALKSVKQLADMKYMNFYSVQEEIYTSEHDAPVSVFGIVINSIIQHACHQLQDECLEDNDHMDRTGLNIFCVNISQSLIYGHCLNLLLPNQGRRGGNCVFLIDMNVFMDHDCFLHAIMFIKSLSLSLRWILKSFQLTTWARPTPCTHSHSAKQDTTISS